MIHRPAAVVMLMGVVIAFILIPLVTMGIRAGGPACPAQSRCVPVSVRTGYLTTKDLTPLRVELYDYVDPSKFEVRPGPPLGFEFPRAYYATGLSLQGGPLATLTLEIDMATWGPYSRAGLAKPGEIGWNAAAREAWGKRNLLMSVSSNYTSRGKPRSPQSIWELEQHPRVSRETWLGMTLLIYQSTSAVHVPPRPPLYVDGVDVEKTTFYAYLDKPERDEPEVVECSPDSACRVYFSYFGRPVSILLDRKVLADTRSIVKGVVRLLDKYRVSTPYHHNERISSDVLVNVTS